MTRGQPAAGGAGSDPGGPRRPGTPSRSWREPEARARARTGEGAEVRPGRPGDRTRGGLALAIGLALALAGCSAVRPQRLEAPPGWVVVVGRIDLDRWDSGQALVPLVRADRGYRQDLVVTRGRPNFVVTLPPGRYRITQIRHLDDGRTLRDEFYDVRVAVDIGPEPVTYVGTLRVRPDFGANVALEIIDEYDNTVPPLRGRYPQLAAPVARSLFRLE